MLLRSVTRADLAAGRPTSLVAPLQPTTRKSQAPAPAPAPALILQAPAQPPINPNRPMPAGSSYRLLADNEWALIPDDLWRQMEEQRLRMQDEEQQSKLEKRKRERAKRMRRARNGGIGAAVFRRRFANRGVEGKEGKNRKGKGKMADGPPKRRAEDIWDGDRLVGRKGTFLPK